MPWIKLLRGTSIAFQEERSVYLVEICPRTVVAVRCIGALTSLTLKAIHCKNQKALIIQTKLYFSASISVIA